MPLGFVLVGGTSSRMRRPKAFLPWYQGHLFEHLVRQLLPVCSEVLLVGQPRAEFTPCAVLEDAFPNAGPLGGVAAALRYSPGGSVPGPEDRADPWRLILSCDCPFVGEGLLQDLVAACRGDAAGIDAIVPQTPDSRLHPLCALWHTRLAEPLREHLELQFRTAGAARSGLRVQGFLSAHRVRAIPVEDAGQLRNLNSMREYLAALGGREME